MKLSRLLLLFFLMLSQTVVFGQVTIGTGTSTGQNIPIEFYYGYTYSQSIYLSSEVNASGNITALDWSYTGTTHSNDIIIYVGTTSKTSFSSTSDWIGIGDLTQVYSGNVSFSTGTIAITFDSPFYYDGADNLVIAVEENTSGYHSSSDEFYCTTQSSSRSITHYSDGTNADPASPPSANALKSATPNVTLYITASSCPPPSSFSATNMTSSTVDLAWTENGTATTWEYVVQAQGTGAPAGAGTSTTSNPVTASGLSAATDYEAYVRADCGSGDYSSWIGPVNFTTACAAVTSFSEDFDGVTAPDLPNCWAAILENVSSSSYVKTTVNAPNSGTNGIQMYSSYGDDAADNMILVSPYVSNLNAGTHRLRFYAKNSTSALDIEVGTITDPTDGSTFTSLQTVDITTTYAEYAVDFSGYAGADNYIAIRRQIPYSNTYDNVYLDDIVWETLPAGAPSCSSVSSPSDASTSVSIAANLTWAANLDATGYKLKIGTTNGGSEFLTLTDVGNVTTYNPSDEFEYGTTYYVTLTPYNAYGDATSCTSTSFTTVSGCRTASTPSDGAVDVDITSSVSWSSLFGASGYKVSIGTTNGGTDILNAYDNSTSTSYSLNGVSLSYSTTYYLTIVAYNAQNEVASGCTSTSFTTAADPTVVAPWTEDFESHSTTTNSTISTNNWSSNPSGTTGSFRWDIDGSGSTPSSNTGPNSAYSGSNYLYTEASSGSTGSVAELTSPPIDVTSLVGSPILTFYYHMYGSSMGTLNVDVYDGTTWNNAVWTISGQQHSSGSDAWTEATVGLSSYVGSGTIQIRFRGVRGSSYYGDMSIDNVTIDAIACPAPSGMNTTLVAGASADLAWTENGTATTWDLEWKAGADFTAGNSEEDGSATTTTNPTYSMTSLSPSTTYYVYYKTDCGSSASAWVGPFTFTTTVACPTPSGIAASNVTATAADLNWTAGALETTWNIEWKAGADFTAGNSEEDGSASPTTNPTYSMTGLSPSTTYYVYYQADCSSDGTSTWVGPLTFTTPCASVTSFSENFDAALALPSCWERAGSSSESKPTSNQANSGSYSWYLYNGYYLEAGIYSPNVSTLGGNYRLRFSAYSTSASTRTLVIGTVDANDNFTQFTSVQLAAQNTWEDFSIDFSAYAGTDTRLAIKHGQATTYQLFYVDDVIWEEMLADDATITAVTPPADGACLGSSETVTVTIKNNGSNTIAVGAASVSISGDATATAVTNTGSIAAGATEDVQLTVDLSTAQTYNLTATVTLSGDGNADNNTSSTTVTKSAADNTTDYVETFTTASTPPTGWNTSGWVIGDNSHDNGGGDNALYVNVYASNTSDVFTTSTVDGIIAGSEFSFDYRIVNWSGYPSTATTGDFGSITVEISTDCGSSYTLLETIEQGNHTETTNWATKQYDLTAYAGSTITVKVTTNWVSGDWFFDVDDVSFLQTPLPVELSSFTAKAEGKVNLLAWSTASEENNDFFDIEHSVDGVEFETIGRVEGNGTTLEKSDYTFVDEKPTPISYYRLRQVDYNDVFEYSNIVVVEREVTFDDNLKFYPVPIQNQLTIEYTASADEEVTVSVTDVMGRVIINQHLTAMNGDNLFYLDMSELAAGSYFINFKSAKGNVIRSVVKQ